MTLAFILLFSLSGIVLPVPRDQSALQPVAQGTPQPTDPQTQNPSPGSPAQDSTAPSKPAGSASAQAPSSQPTAPKKKRRRHKKKISQNCLPASTPSSGAATQAPAASDPATAAGAGNPTAQTAPTNCPPSKTIVRHGGTSDPSIQLAGDQPSATREAANQMLGATEANLKKLTARQLSTNQQDMVNQVRQFMQQSHAAVDAGDFERARTLAWKAQLLSEELVKPGK